MPFVRAGAADLYWKLEGPDGAPPLVLLNSIGTDMDLWSEALPLLRPAFQVLRIDTRGHGASDAPEGDYDLPGLAQDLLQVMDAAGLNRASLAGVSLGGMIAMQAALDAPGRIARLALICTSATMDAAAWRDRVARVRADGMAAIADLAMGRFLSPQFVSLRPEIANGVRRGLLSISAHGYAGCAAAIRDMDLIGRLETLKLPTLVVTGARDTSTPLAGHGEHLLTTIAGARWAELDAAHLAPLEAPRALAETMIEFLAA